MIGAGNGSIDRNDRDGFAASKSLARWNTQQSVRAAQTIKRVRFLPADGRKDLQEIDDQIKKYKDAPADKKKKEKEALDQLLQQSSVLQPGAGLRGFGFGGPGRMLRPGKANRMPGSRPGYHEACGAQDAFTMRELDRLVHLLGEAEIVGRQNQPVQG